jgi:translation initiation factor IF-3
MNTFSAFRVIAQTLLRPQAAAYLPCVNQVARLHVRYKSRSSRGLKIKSRLRNQDIPYEQVHMVNEDKVFVKLSLQQVLDSIDHKEQWVELVAERPNPVVKIVNKKAQLIKQKEMKKGHHAATRRNIIKEVQLTWSSEQGDLEHKLARARTYLEIGARVRIVFMSKANGIPTPQAVMLQKLKDTVEMMADASTEERPVEWRRNMAIIHLRGRVDPNRKLTPEQMELIAVETAAANSADSEMAATKEPEPPSAKAPDPIPVSPAPPPRSPPVDSGKPKDFIDLSGFGYKPPKRKNPLSAKKPVKEYGQRKGRPPN